MTEWQYARNVQPLRLRTELIYPSFCGTIAESQADGGTPCPKNTPTTTT